MKRTKFSQPKISFNVTGKVFLKEGSAIITINISEKTLRQLYINNNKKRTLLAVKTNLPTKDDRSKEYLPFAKKLSRIIQTKKKIKLSLPRIKQWADEIRKLKEQNNLECDRIERVLDWYEENIGGEYIPVIESGYSLRLKFFRLEDAMERAGNKKDRFVIIDDVKYRKDENGKLWHARTGTRYIP